MLRLKVSYGNEYELKKFMKLLPERSVVSFKIPKEQKGTYTRAYIELNVAAVGTVPNDGEQRKL